MMGYIGYINVIREGITAGEFWGMEINLVGAFILGMLNSLNGWYRSCGRLSMAVIKDRLAELHLVFVDYRPLMQTA